VNRHRIYATVNVMHSGRSCVAVEISTYGYSRMSNLFENTFNIPD